MIWELFLFTVAVYFLIVRWKSRHKRKMCSEIKNNLIALPFLGHAYLFIGSEEERWKKFLYIMSETRKCGGLSYLWMANEVYLTVSNPEVATYIMRTSLGKDNIVALLRLAIGNGSIMAEPEFWRPRRKILLPSFTPKRIDSFITTFNEQGCDLMDQLQKHVGKGNFAISEIFSTYSMDVMVDVIFGTKIHAQRKSNPIMDAYKVCFELLAARMLHPWVHNFQIYKLTPDYARFKKNMRVVSDFIDEEIAGKRAELAKKKCNKVDEEIDNEIHSSNKKFTIIDGIIETSGGDEGYSDLELHEELLSLVTAGFDSTTMSLSFTSMLLAKYSDVQDKAYQEIKDVFGDSDRQVTAEDLVSLQYLELVVKESLRLYPPAPVLIRKIDKDLILPTSGTKIVKGTNVFVLLYEMQRDPKYWGEDANEFRPERFSDGSMHPDAYNPFGYIPRYCVGSRLSISSMKTSLSMMLRRYRILPPVVDVGKEEKVKLRIVMDILMRDLNGHQVRLELRK